MFASNYEVTIFQTWLKEDDYPHPQEFLGFKLRMERISAALCCSFYAIFQFVSLEPNFPLLVTMSHSS